MVTVQKGSDMRLFSHLKDRAFCCLQFQKQITSEAHLFFQSNPNFMEIPERHKKFKKIFFDFEIIAFEFFTLDTRFY